MNTTFKQLATPLAIGAFSISAVTGLCMFFHLEIGLIEPVHKWMSWVLVGGILLHISVNWKQFLSYFSRKPAIGILGLSLVITIISLLPVFGEKEEGGNPAKKAATALETTPLETVAIVAKITPEQLLVNLQKKGLIVENSTMTIKDVAGRNGRKEMEVLKAVFENTGVSAKGRGDGDRD
jgi:hypothetical protein